MRLDSTFHNRMYSRFINYSLKRIRLSNQNRKSWWNSFWLHFDSWGGLERWNL